MTAMTPEEFSKLRHTVLYLLNVLKRNRALLIFALYFQPAARIFLPLGKQFRCACAYGGWHSCRAAQVRTAP